MDSDDTDQGSESASSDSSSNLPVDRDQQFMSVNMNRNIRSNNNFQDDVESEEDDEDDDDNDDEGKEKDVSDPKSSAILSPFSSAEENDNSMSERSNLDEYQCASPNRSGSTSRISKDDDKSNGFHGSVSSSSHKSSSDEDEGEEENADDDTDEVMAANREGCLQYQEVFHAAEDGKTSYTGSDRPSISDEINVQHNIETKSSHSSRRSSISSSSNDEECYYNNRVTQQCLLGEELNIGHEDLSDVSDVDLEKHNHNLNNSDDSFKETEPVKGDEFVPVMDLRQKLDQKKILQMQGDAVDGSIRPDTITKSSDEQKNESINDYGKTHDEDALDFEAEEGECSDANKNEQKSNILERESESGNKIEEHLQQSNQTENTETEQQENSKPDEEKEVEDGEELEEGEVTDEDEKRPEETEPKPVCRFYTRGQCTWGMSCRFLHPGVTDKGNYTMFDMVRPLSILGSGTGCPPAGPPRSSGYPPPLHGITADYPDYRLERLSLHHRGLPPPLHHPSNMVYGHHDVRPSAGLESGTAPVVENAWERGLRTAKEMMRKANKRKEQDIDFDDKKMNLTLSSDELEKDPYYLKDRLSPENMHHPIYPEPSGGLYNSPVRYSRGMPPPPHYDEVDLYGRSTRYRELPPHRMPQYEDEKRVRPTREVIVQRVESTGRADEWNDPWMRSRSPGVGVTSGGVGGASSSRDYGDKRRRDRRSYSSNSSYSSTSSSQSDSSSENSSRSISTTASHRRRFNIAPHKSPPGNVLRRHGTGGRLLRSPSNPNPKRSRRSPSVLHSPMGKQRRANMPLSPTAAFNKNVIYNDGYKRKRSPPPPSLSRKMQHSDKLRVKQRHTSSSSESDSSVTDSESDTGSSSSGSSPPTRSKRSPPKRIRAYDKTVGNERKLLKKVDAPKKRSPISIEIKKPATVGLSALSGLSPTQTTAPEVKETKKSRREELLKQLRAVEEAIAKKRSKLS